MQDFEKFLEGKETLRDTDKLVAHSQCAVYPPSSVSALFYGYLKLKLYTYQRKIGTGIGVTENQTGDLQHRKQRSYELC